MRDRLCYSRLPRSAAGTTRTTPPPACAFGLFPEISTPVEKTVEIPRDLASCSAFILISLDFSRRRSLKRPTNRPFRHSSACEGPQNRDGPWAKARRSPFLLTK